MVRKKLKEYETNPLLAALFDRCSSCEAACKVIDDEISALNKKIWSQEQIVEDAQKKISQSIIETKKPEKSRQKAAGCRNTQEVIYTQPLFITPFYLLKGYRSDRLDINIPVIPKAARRDGFTR